MAWQGKREGTTIDQGWIAYMHRIQVKDNTGSIIKLAFLPSPI
jgi:hypothetical protein